jgi:uncharacterized protein YegL
MLMANLHFPTHLAAQFTLPSLRTYGPQGRTVAELDAAIMKALDEVLGETHTTTAERKRAIRAYKQSLATGKSIMDGSPLNDVTSLIRAKTPQLRVQEAQEGSKAY